MRKYRGRIWWVGVCCAVVAAVPIEAQVSHTTGELTGRIVDSAGQPIAGAFVWLRLESRSRPVIPYFMGFGLLRQEAAADGTFAFAATRRTDSLMTEGFRRELLVLAFGYEPVFLAVADTARTITVTLRTHPWDTLQWTLRDPAGHPVPSARAEVLAGDNPVLSGDSSAQVSIQTVQADAQGRVTITVPPRQDITVQLVAAGFRTTKISILSRALTSPATTFTLWRPIVGHVVTATGIPLCHAAVWVNLSHFLGDYPQENAKPVAWTDSTGTFVITQTLYRVPSSTGRGTVGAAAREIALRVWSPGASIKADTLLDAATLSHDPMPVLQLHAVSPTVVHWTTIRPATVHNVYPIALQQHRDGGWMRDETIDVRHPQDSTEQYRVALMPGTYRIVIRDDAIQTDSSLVFTVAPRMRQLALPPVHLVASALQPGRLVPEVTATTLDRQPASLAALRDSVVVLDFWAYWCGPCIDGLPHLAALQTKYRAAGQPVAFVALHDATIRTAAEFAVIGTPRLQRSLHIDQLPFPVWLDAPRAEDAALPPQDRPEGSAITADRYGVLGRPATLVIDRAGRYVGRGGTIAEVEALVQRALAQPPIVTGPERAHP